MGKLRPTVKPVLNALQLKWLEAKIDYLNKEFDLRIKELKKLNDLFEKLKLPPKIDKVEIE